MADSTSRSNKGCWTCRIRHRKCDEKEPACDECADRAVKCHGYGTKPDWMDGGLRERAERARIKSAVKNNLKLARIRRSQTPAQNERLGLDEQFDLDVPLELSNVSTENGVLHDEPIAAYPAPCTPGTLLSQSSRQSTQERFNEPLSPNDLARGNQASALASGTANEQSTTTDLTYQETNFIMHYLDHVYPLQFPYVSSHSKTSRGWLLWLLMKNNPLRQAVLSLSALHQYTTSATTDHKRQEELNFRHGRAIEELQRFLGESITRGHLNKQETVELLAGGTSLISFEVFKGGTGFWQPHLNGLASALKSTAWASGTDSRGVEDTVASTDISESASQEWISNAYDFLATVVLWFDILSCVSTAQRPRTPYKTWLGDHVIDMSLVMGCQNWAMEEVGNLACLDSWKLAANRSRTLSVQQLVLRGQEIEGRLERGLKNLDDDLVERSDICAITRVYALAALVQLQTIISGPHPGIAEIRAAVARAIVAFREVERKKLTIRPLVWSMCIVGCMAELSYQTFFEDMISTTLGQSVGSEFGNLGTTLQIMRKCWDKRLEDPLIEYCWSNAMADLDICVLLI